MLFKLKYAKIDLNCFLFRNEVLIKNAIKQWKKSQVMTRRATQAY